MSVRTFNRDDSPIALRNTATVVIAATKFMKAIHAVGELEREEAEARGVRDVRKPDERPDTWAPARPSAPAT